MKLKILAFAFILAFAITSFGALGVSGVSAQGFPDDPPELAACGGLGTALSEALPATDGTPAPAGETFATVEAAYPGDCMFPAP